MTDAKEAYDAGRNAGAAPTSHWHEYNQGRNDRARWEAATAQPERKRKAGAGADYGSGGGGAIALNA